MEGFQLIETDFTGKLNHIKTPKGIDKTVLLWLIKILREDEIIKRKPIQIELIMANYDSYQYPCIGIKYLSESKENVSELIENKINEILKYSSFLNFIDFVLEVE